MEQQQVQELNDRYYLFTTLVLLAIGGIATGLYYLAKHLFYTIYNLFVVSITVDNTSDLFTWIMRWLAENKGSQFFQSQHLSLHLKRDKIPNWWESKDDMEAPQIEFLPGPGTHIFNFENKTVWLSRSQSGKVTTTGFDKKPYMREVLTLSIYGRDPTVFERLFEEARKTSMQKDQNKTKIYVLDEYGWQWEMALAKNPRDFDSVILDTTLAEEIEQDATKFLSSAAWYAKMGLPYRRGYLLFGPPGTGKTSFTLALAAKMRLNICVLTLSNNTLDDNKLNSRLNDAPANSIILLEDVDSVFIDRNVAKDHASRVTFSGLLNAIDGVASQESRMFFMTTNHIEKLDAALLRPGRCDMKCKFDYASKNQIRRMYQRFYKQENESKAVEFASLVPEHTISMAALQEHLMRHKSGDTAIAKYDELLNMEKKQVVTTFRDVAEWLRRLGLAEYTEIFNKQKVTCLQDLKNTDSETLGEYGIKSMGHRQKILHMLQGEDHAVADFEYATDKIVEDLLLARYGTLSDWKNLCDWEKVSVHQVKEWLFRYGTTWTNAKANVIFMTNPATKVEPTFEIDPQMQVAAWVKHAKQESIFTSEILDALKKHEIEVVEDLVKLEQDDWEEIANIKNKGKRIVLHGIVAKLGKLLKPDDKDD